MVVRDGGVRIYGGDHDYYLYKRGLATGGRTVEQDAAAGAPGPSADEPEAGRRRRGAEERRAQAEARNRAYRALKGPQEQVKRLEAEMTRLQARRDALTGQMADPDIIADADRYQEVLAEYAALEPELERTERAWLEAAEELDRLENDVT